MLSGSAVRIQYGTIFLEPFFFHFFFFFFFFLYYFLIRKSSRMLLNQTDCGGKLGIGEGHHNH